MGHLTLKTDSVALDLPCGSPGHHNVCYLDQTILIYQPPQNLDSQGVEMGPMFICPSLTHRRCSINICFPSKFPEALVWATSNQGLWECPWVLDAFQNTESRICSRRFRELTAPEFPWTAVLSDRQGSYPFCQSLFHQHAAWYLALTGTQQVLVENDRKRLFWITQNWIQYAWFFILSKDLPCRLEKALSSLRPNGGVEEPHPSSPSGEATHGLSLPAVVQSWHDNVTKNTNALSCFCSPIFYILKGEGPLI